MFKTDISQTASYLKPRQTEKNMTSKNVVIPTEVSVSIDPTFSDKPTEGFQAPKTKVIPRSGYDYPNEWSTELFEKVGSCDC